SLVIWASFVVTSSKGVCFFCQAEDGIRDRNVTGVQTCALPISLNATEVLRNAAQQPGGLQPHEIGLFSPESRELALQNVPDWPRSEERRVGKEDRARWSQYHYRRQRVTRLNENICGL